LADKDFKVKNKLFVNGLSNASGVILATNNNLDSSTTLPTQYGGTGTTTSPNAGQIPYSSSGTNYAPTDLSSLTISSSGGSTITAASASTKGLIIKGAASQTADLQQWQISNGNKTAWVDGNGQFETGYFFTNFGGGSYKNSGLITVNPANNIVPLVIAGASGQTSDLQQWRNSSGTLMAAVKADGSFRAGGANGATKFLVDQFGTLSLGTDRNITGTPTYLFVQSQASSDIGAVVKGASGQSANLQEWQNSAGTVLTSVNSFGDMTAPGVFSSGSIRGGTTSSLGGFHSYTSNIPSIPVVVNRAASSQTANIEEWQNSNGTVLTKVTSDGSITAPGLSVQYGIYSTTVGKASINPNYDTGSMGIYTENAANKGLVVRGAASQSANLQEWQNSSGTVLASISAAGNLTVQDLTVNGTTTTINSTTLTVDDKNIELASVASPTDTTADGAGITIKGATDKTFNWVQSTGAFTSSEPISTPALSVSGNSVSSNITLAAGKRYFVDTTSARTLTLPASPTLADTIEIYDASGTAATNNITIARNGSKINGQTEDAIIDVNQASSVFVYTGATVGWRFD
jgi:hypothetical protein